MSDHYVGQATGGIGFGQQMVGGYAPQAQQAGIKQVPRLEGDVQRLERVTEELAKLLSIAHSHLDRIVGAAPPANLPGNGRESAPVPSQSTLHRLDQALDMLAGITQHSAASLVERLGAV